MLVLRDKVAHFEAGHHESSETADHERG